MKWENGSSAPKCGVCGLKMEPAQQANTWRFRCSCTRDEEARLQQYLEDQLTDIAVLRGLDAEQRQRLHELMEKAAEELGKTYIGELSREMDLALAGTPHGLAWRIKHADQ